jgi:hypothetical protein
LPLNKSFKTQVTDENIKIAESLLVEPRKLDDRHRKLSAGFTKYLSNDGQIEHTDLEKEEYDLLRSSAKLCLTNESKKSWNQEHLHEVWTSKPLEKAPVYSKEKQREVIHDHAEDERQNLHYEQVLRSWVRDLEMRE